MNIIVTGGSGFIGTHLLSFLLERRDVDLIVNIDLQPSIITHEKLKDLKIDIREEFFFPEIEDINFELCIHLAALCKEPGFPWLDYFLTNTKGTDNLLSFCNKMSIRNVLFTSTMMVFKAGDYKRLENDIKDPNTAYGISKLLAEKSIEVWAASDKNRSFQIVRPAVVFGENENANFTRLYKSLSRGVFPYVGRRDVIKSNIYVKELILFIDFLIKNKSKNKIYNFSFPEKHTLQNIIENFEEVFDLKVIKPVIPYRLLRNLAFVFEFFNSIGIKNPIHHRRIEKLNQSSYIFPKNALESGYKFHYNLKTALSDWKTALQQH